MGLALRAIHTTIRHVPTSRLPVTPALLKQALTHVHQCPSPEATKLGLLLMFMGFLRQSSVAPQSVSAYDPTRHLSASDLTPLPDGLRLNIKWTKTIQAAADATHLLLPPTADYVLCPVRAFAAYSRTAPSSSRTDAPLLRHSDGNTLTVPYLRRQWAALVRLAGWDPAVYTLHSLRKGAADYTKQCRKGRLKRCDDPRDLEVPSSQSIHQAYTRPFKLSLLRSTDTVSTFGLVSSTPHSRCRRDARSDVGLMLS